MRGKGKWLAGWLARRPLGEYSGCVSGGWDGCAVPEEGGGRRKMDTEVR